MAEPKRPQPRRLNLEIPADLAATYSNFALITHSNWEMFIDFAQILPNVPKARVQTRVVLTPVNAKMLLKALEENISRYEQNHGEIVLPPRLPSLADQLFGSVRHDGENEQENDEQSEPQPDGETDE